MSGLQEAREEAASIARDLVRTGASNLNISEHVARIVFGATFVEELDATDPGIKSEITITRDGKILGRVTIER